MTLNWLEKMEKYHDALWRWIEGTDRSHKLFEAMRDWLVKSGEIIGKWTGRIPEFFYLRCLETINGIKIVVDKTGHVEIFLSSEVYPDLTCLPEDLQKMLGIRVQINKRQINKSEYYLDSRGLMRYSAERILKRAQRTVQMYRENPEVIKNLVETFQEEVDRIRNNFHQQVWSLLC